MQHVAATDAALNRRSNELRAAYAAATSHEERVRICRELDAVHAEIERRIDAQDRGTPAWAFGATFSSGAR